VLPIAHDDSERVRFTGGGSRRDSHRLNVTYAVMKRNIEALHGGTPLSFDERMALRKQVAEALRRAAATGKPQTVEHRIAPNIGRAGFLFDGRTGYLINGVLRYEMAPVRTPGIAARLLLVLRKRRLFSTIRRRLRGS